MMTAHFSEAELACRCGCGKSEMDRAFLDKLEALRIAYGEPMTITSGFRCNNYNMRLKDASKHSQHLVGKAVDVAVVDSSKRFKLVSLAMSFGFSGIGIDGAFIHLDTRDSGKVMWMYPSKKE